MDETTGGSTNPNASTGEDAAGAAARFARAKEKAKEFVGEKYESASGAVRDGYSAASGAVRDGYSAARAKVDEVDVAALADQARAYVRSNPGKALLISVGVGFLVGLLLRRDED
jgi:ElaB/YqjD/DUF883 family membrane-anchored ribosome-binding protein